MFFVHSDERKISRSLPQFSENFMIRQDLFNDIEARIALLVTRIELRGALNILDLHIHSENFLPELFKLIFGWELENVNTTVQNMPAIDLVDHTRKLIAQVSATGTKQKINSSLSKDLSSFTSYTFKFICIGRPESELRKLTYNIPNGITFNPSTDIHDAVSLLKKINAMPTEEMETISEFLRREIKLEPDPKKVESNLASIIKSMSEEDWNASRGKVETIPYDIEEKITYNQLDKTRALIDDYKVHYIRLEKIYAEYDLQGRNKSASILNSIRRDFIGLNSSTNADCRFLETIDLAKAHIQKSANPPSIADEELELCVGILVVDAFIRCKIFDNPSTARHADS